MERTSFPSVGFVNAMAPQTSFQIEKSAVHGLKKSKRPAPRCEKMRSFVADMWSYKCMMHDDVPVQCSHCSGSATVASHIVIADQSRQDQDQVATSPIHEFPDPITDHGFPKECHHQKHLSIFVHSRRLISSIGSKNEKCS